MKDSILSKLDGDPISEKSHYFFNTDSSREGLSGIVMNKKNVVGYAFGIYKTEAQIYLYLKNSGKETLTLFYSEYYNGKNYEEIFQKDLDQLIEEFNGIGYTF